jgi:hypothetical protein
MLSTPVALIIFNRPETTAAVFGEIAKARPSKLFIIADGPRSERSKDRERCATARAVTEQVDWPCDVRRKYSETNLGCGFGPAEGIGWLFDQVEEAIILEDDCVPRPSFFRFCEELLARYRDDERIMMIGGRYSQYNVDSWSRFFDDSYAFTHHHNCWGWATWKRAWDRYDIRIKGWPELRDTDWLMEMFDDKSVQNIWREIFDRIYSSDDDLDAWDFQWSFAMWARQGLAIKPSTHLVSNIGFGEHATHTKANRSDRGGLLEDDIAFPLKHPSQVKRNAEIDRLESALLAQHHPQSTGWRGRLKRYFSRALAKAASLHSKRQ